MALFWKPWHFTNSMVEPFSVGSQWEWQQNLQLDPVAWGAGGRMAVGKCSKNFWNIFKTDWYSSLTVALLCHIQISSGIKDSVNKIMKYLWISVYQYIWLLHCTTLNYLLSIEELIGKVRRLCNWVNIIEIMEDLQVYPQA